MNTNNMNNLVVIVILFVLSVNLVIAVETPKVQKLVHNFLFYQK